MMHWKPSSLAIAGLTLLTAPIFVQAKIYISSEQAQQILFPNMMLTKQPIIITDDLQERMRVVSSIRHPFQGDRIWRAPDGGWLMIDEVVGKHEMITYAVAISTKGSVLGIEVLEYVESY
jgi:hypothetical protein